MRLLLSDSMPGICTLKKRRPVTNVGSAIPFPVICLNASCNTLWLAQRIVSAGPNTTVNMIGNMVAPCPGCGGTGRIPDGVYTVSSAKLFNDADVDRVLSAINALRENAAAGASKEEIEATISRDYSFLEGLKQYLPKNAIELAAYLAIIATIVGYCSRESDTAQRFETHIQVEIRQILDQSKSKSESESSDGRDH